MFVLRTVWNLDNGKQVQTGRIFIYPIYLSMSVPPPSLLIHPTMSTKHTNASAHTSPLSLSSFHVSAIVRGRQAENARSSLVCRTRKPLVVIQQPNNHRSVWLLTCVWAERTLACTHTHQATLSFSVAHTGANPERSLFLAHVNVSNQSGQGAL